MRVALDADLDFVFAKRGVAWTDRLSGNTTKREHQTQGDIRRKVHLIGDDLEEACDTGFGVAIEIAAHATEINLEALVPNLDDKLMATLINEGAHIVDPAAEW